MTFKQKRYDILIMRDIVPFLFIGSLMRPQQIL